MQLSDRIREAFSSTGLTQTAFAAKIGVSKGAVSQWLSGVNSDLRAGNAQAIETLTGFRATWLVSGKGEKRAVKDGGAITASAPAIPTTEESNVSEGPAIRGLYPLISEVQAGMWTELCDNFAPGDAEDWLPSTKPLGECGYMLRVKGKSMEDPGARISFTEGMVLHVKAHADPQPGDYVIVRRDGTGEATFKRFVMIDGHPYLEAINPDWPKDLKYLAMQPGDTWCGVVVDASLGGLR